jgi:hypothetical protein
MSRGQIIIESSLSGLSAVIAGLRRRLNPWARSKSPLSVPPPRSSGILSPPVLSQVHSVEPELVSETTVLTYTADDRLRRTVIERVYADDEFSMDHATQSTI